MNLKLDKAFRKAIKAHQEGNRRDAEKFYKSVIKGEPNHPDANHNLGILAFEDGKIDTALFFFKKSVEVAPGVENYWVSYAKALVRQNRFKEAEAVIHGASEKGFRASIFDELKKYISSNKPQTNDEPSASQVQELISHFNRGDLKVLIEKSEAISNEFPKSAFIPNILGAAYAKSKNFESAILNCQLAIEIDPTQAEPYNTLAIAFRAMGDSGAAIESARTAIKLDSKFSHAYHNLGNALKDKGAHQEAIKNYKLAIDLDPKMYEAYDSLGVLLTDLDEIDLALENLEKAVAIKPDFVEALNHAVKAKIKIGDPEGALMSCEAALRIRPDYAPARVNRGLLYQEKQLYEQALQDYNFALEVDPSYVPAYLNISSLFYDQGKYSDALMQCRNALKIDPDSTEVNSMMGDVLFELGNFADARIAYQQALVSDDSRKIRARFLECLFLGKAYTQFNDALAAISKSEKANMRVAAVSALASHSLNQKDIYPFCKDPMNYVKISNLKDCLEKSEALIKELAIYLDQLPKQWEPRTNATRKGFKSDSDLFTEPVGAVKTLKMAVIREIERYFDHFSPDPCLFISERPKQHQFSAWYVKMIKDGHQVFHLHPAGWLSGVVYLKTIESPQDDEGAIEFSLNGFNQELFPSAPKLVHKPKDGDLVMFPSSLFHRTIPIKSDVERCVLAFDLLPKLVKF